MLNVIVWLCLKKHYIQVNNKRQLNSALVVSQSEQTYMHKDSMERTCPLYVNHTVKHKSHTDKIFLIHYINVHIR